MAEYKLLYGTTDVLRTDDGATVPDDPANSARQDYDAWLDAGGVPDQAETFDEMQARYFRDLAAKTLQVFDQGVDGPFSTGDPTQTQRSWPTTIRAWTWLDIMQRWSEIITDPVPPPQFPFFTLKGTDGNASGDLAGLGTGGVGNTKADLEKAMYDHLDALIVVLKQKWLAVRDAQNEADLQSINIDAGWPLPPSNP